MFSLSAVVETHSLCLVEGVTALIFEMGDKEPKVSFLTGLMEMFGEWSDKMLLRPCGPSGVPKFRVRALIVCLP